MKPLKNLLLIKLDPKPEMDEKERMYVRENWEKPQNIAEVLAVGPLVTDVKVGDKVMINPYAVLDTQVKDEKIIKGDDILCLV